MLLGLGFKCSKNIKKWIYDVKILKNAPTKSSKNDSVTMFQTECFKEKNYALIKNILMK